jgi:ribosomal protein L37AE/L43A
VSKSADKIRNSKIFVGEATVDPKRCKSCGLTAILRRHGRSYFCRQCLIALLRAIESALTEDCEMLLRKGNILP